MKRGALAAPNLQTLLRSENAADRIMKLVMVGPKISDDRYLSWDELRHRTPPEGLSSEEWWLALKLKRSASAIPFGELAARNGAPLKVTHRARIDSALATLDRQLAGRIATEEPAPDHSLREQIVASSLMEEAIHSSLFEGAVSTREIAKEMLRRDRAPISRDERMILNNYRAMTRLREMSKDDLTVECVLELHSILTEGTLDDPLAAGRLQTPDEERVHVYDSRMHRIVFDPPPAVQLPDRMRKLVAFANAPDIEEERFVHPVLRSILLHFQLAYDHPFLDGNGRTARALFYWSMLRRGYWMTEFLSISRLLYRQRGPYENAFVQTETDEQDGTYFVLQQLDVLQRAVTELNEYVVRKSDAQKRMRTLLHDRRDLNHRQLALLDHAMRHPEAEYTYDSHSNAQRVTRITARADLLQLTKIGLLQQQRQGRQHVFRPTERLREEVALGKTTTVNSRTAAGTARRIPRR